MIFLHVSNPPEVEDRLSDVAVSPTSPRAFLPPSIVRYSIAPRRSGYPWMELFGTLVAGMTFLCSGLVQAYTSGAINSIQVDSTSNIVLSTSSIAWIGSAPLLASLLGTIIAGPMMEKLGRRNTIKILAIPFILGWLIIGTSHNLVMIFVGRLFGGVGLGMARATAPVYVSEISRAKHRGKLGYLPPIMCALGVLLGVILSSSCYWKTLALWMTIFPVCLLFAATFLPETPHWLIRQNQEDEAFDTLKKLRFNRGNVNDDFHIYNEIAEIRETIEGTSPFTEDDEDAQLLEILEKPGMRRRASLISALMIAQQFSGASAVVFYLQQILDHGPNGGSFLSTSGPSKDARAEIVAIFHFLAFFITFPCVDKVGRKWLLKVSGILMTIPHVVLATYFFLYGNLPSSPPSNSSVGALVLRSLPVESGGTPKLITDLGENESIEIQDYAIIHQLVPLVCLCWYIAAFSASGPVPTILMSEVFGNKVRGYLCSVAIFICNASAFLVNFLFPYLLYGVSPVFTFAIFAISSFLITVIGCKIPETRGKSLAEIENLFKGPGDFHGKVKGTVEVESCTEQYCSVITSPQDSSAGGTLTSNKKGLEKY